MNPIELFLIVLLAYISLGLCFGLLFIFIGAGRLDPAAKNAPLTTRALFLPGALLLWPFLLSMWISKNKQGSRQ